MFIIIIIAVVIAIIIVIVIIIIIIITIVSAKPLNKWAAINRMMFDIPNKEPSFIVS